MNKKYTFYVRFLFCLTFSASFAQQQKNDWNALSEIRDKQTEVCASQEGTVPFPNTITYPLTSNYRIDIAEDVVITDININIDVSHTWMSDLRIVLESPLGTTISIIDGSCPEKADMIATFDDAGETISCAAADVAPTISGVVIPQELLSTFNGESSLGTWTLMITDLEALSDGTLNSWSIEYCSGEGVVLETQTFNNLSIALYPNPATDVVSIKFNNISQLEVTLFDVLSRKVLSKTLRKDNNDIDVSKLAAGTYMVQMKNEKNEILTKNLIIE
ncbi:MAG: subtilisin-like proprotein convertase family protein [Pseudohongiellaceae bacterium]|jgi:subtilisin-like proprotein convertase family protein